MQVTKVVFNLRKRIGEYEHEDVSCEVIATGENEAGTDMLNEAKKICYSAISKPVAMPTSSPRAPTTNGSTARANGSYQPTAQQTTGKRYADNSAFAATAPFAYDFPFAWQQDNAGLKAELKAKRFKFYSKKDGNTINGWYGNDMLETAGASQFCIRSPEPYNATSEDDNIPF